MGGVRAFAAQEQGRYALWLPVGLALGILLWFEWAGEPPWFAYGLALGSAGLWLGLWRIFGAEMRLLAVLGVGVAIGFLSIGLRAHMVAAPVLEGRYYGPIEGRLIGIDRAASDLWRVTLDHPRLERLAHDRTPRALRITLHNPGPRALPQVGSWVMTTGHLAAPQGPVMPGGFDFQRLAWFRGLGAIGYARVPVLLAAPPEGYDLLISRLRQSLSDALTAEIEGEAGALAAAMLTGDRSKMGKEAVADLRDSTLYHLVSISGVHMSLAAGIVFLTLRMALTLGRMTLLGPPKQVAACGAICAAAFYLALAGGDIATLRAFVMVAIFLGAALFNRRAISLRSLALAAVVVLSFTPETLVEPGFQMSFAATAALILGFETLQGSALIQRMPKILRPIFLSVAASVLAGMASAPFAAVHFNRFGDYGLVANLLVSPVMALVVMPAGVAAAALAPLGLAAPALWMLDLGCRWILLVGHEVSSWHGAVRLIAAPPPTVLALLGCSATAFCLLRGRLRWGGAALAAVSIAIWAQAKPPDLLIAPNGALAALQSPEGLSLSSATAASFAARVWLEHSADPASAEIAAKRAAFTGPDHAREGRIGGINLAVAKGKRGLENAGALCGSVDLLILNAPAPKGLGGGCQMIDTTILEQSGAIMGRLEGTVLSLEPTRSPTPRLWEGRASPPPWQSWQIEPRP